MQNIINIITMILLLVLTAAAVFLLLAVKALSESMKTDIPERREKHEKKETSLSPTESSFIRDLENIENYGTSRKQSGERNEV